MLDQRRKQDGGSMVDDAENTMRKCRVHAISGAMNKNTLPPCPPRVQRKRVLNFRPSALRSPFSVLPSATCHLPSPYALCPMPYASFSPLTAHLSRCACAPSLSAISTNSTNSARYPPGSPERERFASSRAPRNDELCANSDLFSSIPYCATAETK